MEIRNTTGWTDNGKAVNWTIVREECTDPERFITRIWVEGDTFRTAELRVEFFDFRVREGSNAQYAAEELATWDGKLVHGVDGTNALWARSESYKRRQKTVAVAYDEWLAYRKTTDEFRAQVRFIDYVWGQRPDDED